MKVKKVTISLPAEVYAWGEAERATSNSSRSEFVTQLYRDRMYQQELEERARRYEKAFREHPYTEEENEVHHWMAQEFWDMMEADDPSDAMSPQPDAAG